MLNIRHIAIMFFVTISSANAVSFSGELKANKEYPLYISKNTGSNPDGIKSIIGVSYKIKEANVLPATWYRVEVPNAQVNKLRWVEAVCGDVITSDTQVDQGNDEEVVTPGVSNQNACSVSGNANSYVLALSMQAGFCETSGKNKPECLNLTANSPYSKQLSLHGLWPNKNACGTNYGFCNNTQKKSSHCDYAPVALTSQTELMLKQYMASMQYGSCLERHEWYKHGTCQGRTPDDYYSLAINLTKQVNDTDVGSYIATNIGKSITAVDFNKRFDEAFGAGSSKKVQLICNRGLLTDLYIELPNLEDNNESSIKELLPLAKNAKPKTCSDTFKLSNFHN
jgi:ribonuclease T2